MDQHRIRTEEIFLLRELPEDCDPRLVAFHRLWESIRPAPGVLPGRQHFDPIDVGKQLPWVWLVDVQREPMRFRYRLLGTEQVRAMEKDHTGKWIDEVPGVARAAESYRQFFSVAKEGILAYRRGRPAYHTHKDFLWLERLLLPLARDGKTVDMILAMTIYDKRVPEGA